MSIFTHHNTCINVLDVIISTIRTDEFIVDKFKVLEQRTKKDGEQKPSVHIKDFEHPKNIKFVPISFDDTRHLNK
jgi:hypothetical protein